MARQIDIHLTGGKGELPLGSSRWWGCPDLPSGWALPMMPDPDAAFAPYDAPERAIGGGCRRR